MQLIAKSIPISFFSHTITNASAILVLSVTAGVIVVLICPMFFLTGIPGIAHKTSAAAGTTTNSVLSSPLINQASDLKKQSRGFSNFGNLPSSGIVINSSNQPLTYANNFQHFPSSLPSNNNNIVTNTPFAPFANYGQFSTPGSAATQSQASSTQYPYPSQYQNNPYPYQAQQPLSASTLGSTNAPSSYPYQNQPYPGAYQNQLSPSSGPATNGVAQNPYTSGQYPNQPQQEQQNLGASPSSPANYSIHQQGQPQSFNNSSRHLSTLVVRTVVDSKPVGGEEGLAGGSASSSSATNVSELVQNVYANPDGYTYVYHYAKGSPSGATLNLHPGSFGVSEIAKINSNSSDNKENPTPIRSYYVSYSGDCHTTSTAKSHPNTANNVNNVYGYGTVKLGETKTCVVTNTFHK
jgi:hypothetical protein